MNEKPSVDLAKQLATAIGERDAAKARVRELEADLQSDYADGGWRGLLSWYRQNLDGAMRDLGVAKKRIAALEAENAELRRKGWCEGPLAHLLTINPDLPNLDPAHIAENERLRQKVDRILKSHTHLVNGNGESTTCFVPPSLSGCFLCDLRAAMEGQGQ